jgi:hypothetical protein
MAVFSLLSENLGRGITLKNNKLDLDTSLDFVWTGKNFFTKPVIFSTEQIFPLNNLSHDNCTLGSIIASNGTSWQAVAPGSFGQVLTYSTKGAIWANLNLNIADGVLPLSKGGTGWSKFPLNGILMNSGKDVLDIIPIPTDKKVLFSSNNEISWHDFSELSKEIVESLPKHYSINKNKFIFENENPVIKVKDVISAGVQLNKNNSFSITINNPDLSDHLPAFPTSSIVLNNENKNNLFEINTNINDNVYSSVFSIDSSGEITKGSLSTDKIKGIFSVDQGGTGIVNYDAGDLIFALSNNQLGKLSTYNSEGFILKVINGIPTYVPHDKTDFDGLFGVPVTFSSPSNSMPSITLSKGDLLAKTAIGAFEFDGNYLYLTTNQNRRKLSFADSDISGLSSNITGIVDCKNGGAGKDLSGVSVGKLIIKDNEANLSGLEQGSPGSVLVSLGEGQHPQWRFILNDINADQGIKLNKNNSNLNISIDTSDSFEPIWSGKHTFATDVNFNNSQLILSSMDDSGDKAPLKFQKSKAPALARDGELWFDGKDLFMSTNNKKINITKVDDNANPAYDYIPSHYLTLGAGSEAIEGRKIRMKVPVPHLVTKGSLVHTKWRIRRLDITIDEMPCEDNAVFKLTSGHRVLLNTGIVLQGKDSGSVESFDEAFVETGEMLQVECIKTGGSNYWSIFLLIDLI